MKISIIAAIARNRAIGKDNRLLWHLPADMKFFKNTTLGHPIITGRKNYESIPDIYRPLPGRQNIVLTHQDDYLAPGAIVVNDLEDAIGTAIEAAEKEGRQEVFIIGGGAIYRESLDKELVDRMYLTLVDDKPNADTFFPEWNENDWEMRLLVHQEIDEKHDYAFDIYVFDRRQKLGIRNLK